jgi:hypothetical protein
MKITITADGGSPVTLCDHGREGPSGFTVTQLRNIDVLQFVCGAWSRPKDRGNKLTQATFNVSREHATIAAAQKYNLTRSQQLPAEGVIDFELSDLETHLVMRDATCEISMLPPIGVLTTESITLKGGMIDEAVQVLTQTGGQIFTSEGNPIFVNREEL